MRGSVGSVAGGLSRGQPSQGVGSAVMCGMWGSQRVGLADMCGDMRLLTVVAPEDGRSSRGCAGGVARVARVREQEIRANRNVNLAVLEEPGSPKHLGK